MNRQDDPDLSLELDELTVMPRSSSELESLQVAFLAQGVQPQTAQLVSFVEDEESSEYGVVVSSARDIFEYVRVTTPGADSEFVKWQRIEPDENFLRQYPVLRLALSKFGDSI